MSMQFAMSARIDQSETHSGRYYTVVTTPAPDAFSHPARFKVQSDQPIGQPGQNVDLVVNVSGIVRQKDWRDKQTGQMRTMQEAQVYLNVVTAKPAQLAQPQSVTTAQEYAEQSSPVSISGGKK